MLKTSTQRVALIKADHPSVGTIHGVALYNASGSLRFMSVSPRLVDLYGTYSLYQLTLGNSDNVYFDTSSKISFDSSSEESLLSSVNQLIDKYGLEVKFTRDFFVDNFQ